MSGSCPETADAYALCLARYDRFRETTATPGRTATTAGGHVNRQKALAPPGGLDQFPELDRLAELAIAVFTKHVSDADCCAVCGTGWPCEQVVLADHNLEVL